MVAGYAPPVATGRSAAVEATSGLLSKAMLAADVRGPRWAVDALTPRLRTAVARGLITSGEVLTVVDVTPAGVVRLLPARGSVSGGPDPDSWIYWLSTSGPSTPGRWRRYSRREVAHFRYETDPDRPWRGVTPADGLDARLGALISAALAREAGAPHGNVLAVRPTRQQPANAHWGPEATEEAKRRMPDALGELSRGGLAILATSELVAGQSDTKQGVTARIGLAPPPSVAALHAQAFNATLASFGLPPNIVTETGYSRDALRQAETHFLRPLVEAVAGEVGRVLEVDIEVGPTVSRSPADWVSLGRAANSLKQAGYHPDRIDELLRL